MLAQEPPVVIRLLLSEYSFFFCIGLTLLLPSPAVARPEITDISRGYSELNPGCAGLWGR
jgi:hypothetical protein